MAAEAAPAHAAQIATAGAVAVIDAQVFKIGRAYRISIPNAELPEVLGVVAVLTDLSITVGAKRADRYLYKNPSSCSKKKGWTATLTATYEDGSSNTVSSTQKCKPAKQA